MQSLGVTLTHLSISFPSRPTPVHAVANVSLTVPPGQFTSLLGPSGCGKSTLLRAIAGLQAPTSGSIDISNRTDPRSDVAFVFQDAHLLPWRNVLRNVALPLELMGVPKPARLQAAHAALDQVGLADAATRYPAQLSGGMKMRASLARALITNPKLLLLDEPFAALDEITRHRLDETLRQLWLQHRMTTLFVTHSIQEAVYLSERAIVFTRRPAQTLLDHPIPLAESRPPTIRTEQTFAQQSRLLYDALAQEESIQLEPQMNTDEHR